MTTAAVTIYHNPRCSQSRATLALLRARGIEPEIVEYLKEPLSAAQLRALLPKLGIRAAQLLRRKEPVFQSQLAATELTEERCIAAMVEHPILIERPIVVCGDRAVLGRPPENVLDLI